MTTKGFTGEDFKLLADIICSFIEDLAEGNNFDYEEYKESVSKLLK